MVPTHRSPVRSCGHQIAKTQIRQCSPQPAQASPPGHFRHPGCLQRFGSSFRSFENCFARAVWKEQVAVLFGIASAPHGHARPQAQHSHQETQTAPASWSFSRNGSFHGHVSFLSAALHERSGRRRKPQDSRRRLVGGSRPQPPYGSGRHDSQK